MARIIPLTDFRVPGDALAAARSAPAVTPTGMVADMRGRMLRDLRISVTDRCNFRCVYCMPKDVYGHDYPFLPHADLLTFEEIARLARVFKGHGVEKIRLTGGEPLLRKHLERLVAMLADIGGLDLTLTTNGALLARKARDLKAAGLNRVTVSLDALDDAVFRAMNDVDFPVARVLDGIDAAAAAGLAPVKINMVVKRGTNEQEILPMARHFRGSGHILRFIEYMDVGHTNGWRMDDVVPSAEVIGIIGRELPLEPVDANYAGEVAARWRYRDGSGEIGVISSVTQAFCSDCTRARLATDGKLYTCLFATSGVDFRALLRAGKASDDEIGNYVAAIWGQRADRYSEMRSENTRALPKVEMSYIGG
ncbi:MAG TPA: GTP 3',8-cyclase MoaA [Casimicrobiaceae bacterium]|jgi:cyclic pyranopterin phosphate synthase|nr:GTP 3',8-cyclase MoaA [Casimicrobiaceae bacterium]